MAENRGVFDGETDARALPRRRCVRGIPEDADAAVGVGGRGLVLPFGVGLEVRSLRQQL